MRKKILVILNPVSKNGKNRRYVDRVVRHLRMQLCDVCIYETSSAGDAISYLLNLKEKFDVIVAAGGDGTVNEVINGMVHIKTTPLALIPAGTTNVLAKELGLPRRVKAVSDVITNGLAMPVYLGQLNDRRFSMMVGLGYDAWVVNRVNLKVKKHFGKLAYVISMFQQLFTFGKQSFVTEIDGRVISASSMIVTQGKYYAGSFVLSKKADLSVPSMQAVVIETQSWWKFFLTVLALPFGLMENLPFVQSISAKEIKIKSLVSKPDLDVLQIDGDPAGTLPAFLKIEEEPISILVKK